MILFVNYLQSNEISHYDIYIYIFDKFMYALINLNDFLKYDLLCLINIFIIYTRNQLYNYFLCILYLSIQHYY